MSEGTGSATGQAQVGAVGGHTGASTGSTTGQAVVAASSTITQLDVSQMGAEALVDFYPTLSVSQNAVLVMGAQQSEFLDVTQAAALALTQTTAESETVTQIAAEVLGANDMTDLNVSQVAVLTLVRSNPDRRKLRAWRFVQDGRWFYVLHLGMIGTIVFDTVTRKWSEWQTFNMNNWRAAYGINWNAGVLAGGIDNNLVYDVRADVSDDDGLPIISIITGGYPMRMRNSISCDEVMVVSSVGVSTPVGDATMRLRTSDDYGVTWTDWGALALSTATPRTQVTWQSLGIITAPGRIFELTDSGAAKRINSLGMYSADEEG